MCGVPWRTSRHCGRCDTVHSALLIIGSGPAGVAAAEAFREHQTEGAIRILTADPEPPYARPPLSKEFLRGSNDDIALHPPSWYAERTIELITGAHVDAVDVNAKTVLVADQRHTYDSLVIATGSGPTPLPVPGGEQAYRLRSAEDARALRNAAVAAGSAVVVGAGFIGCEAAASLAAQGISVTLVAPDPAPQVKRLGPDAGARLRELVERTGVKYLPDAKVAAVHPGSVALEDGTELAADLVLAATGVSPHSSVAEAAGLEIRDSRIVVGSDMRTSAPDVYAAGDVAVAFNDTAGRHVAVEHWQDAEDQGRIAGTVAAGGDSRWDSVPGFWTSIGDADVKYQAWGDGFTDAVLVEHGGGFTVWYTDDAGNTVGVLTYQADEDYESGGQLVAQHAPPVHQ
ncbi:pyridine nucleotide-disulfide oxidoreductase [Mycobacterium sp. djl-10]|nr:pyridine nucleotide-disulfide oxidoreductase [Mycobacterium sp. djl-10]